MTEAVINLTNKIQSIIKR